jgi:hypothetical protein
MGGEHSGIELGTDQKHVQNETELPDCEKDFGRRVLNDSGHAGRFHRLGRREYSVLKVRGEETEQGRSKKESCDHFSDDLRLAHAAKDETDSPAGDENDG